MLSFPNLWHIKTTFFDGRGFAERQSSLLWSESENPYKSWTLWDIWINFCILIYLIFPAAGFQNGVGCLSNTAWQVKFFL